MVTDRANQIEGSVTNYILVTPASLLQLQDVTNNHMVTNRYPRS